MPGPLPLNGLYRACASIGYLNEAALLALLRLTTAPTHHGTACFPNLDW
jgi:hypothetical protein